MSQLAILLIIGLIACICFAIGYLYAHRTSDNVEYYWGEKGYLNLIQKIVTSGVDRDDRTGTGTRALFGEVLKFDLALGFPLLTTKFVSFKTILTELLWFLKGTDNIDYLRSKGVKIWDDNTSREFLDNRGLTHYSVGQLGPGYGWQWRRAGEDYDQRHCSSRTPGFDQIAEMVRLIKDDPNSRRIFMTAWNVKDLDKMALVPCHVSVQFHVAKGILHTTMYQRSADMGLGVPYNIASYALLTHMLCHLCDLQPGVLTMNLGDVHVYHNHVEPLMLQLCRKRKPLPTLLIKESVSNIDDFDEHHFQLIGYDHYAAIKMQMAV